MSEPYYTIDTLEPGKSIGFLVKRCGVLMTRVAERRFGTEPVSFVQWLVLASLGRYEHVSATKLSEETGYDMGALTRIVDVLERGGLLRRERSSAIVARWKSPSRLTAGDACKAAGGF